MKNLSKLIDLLYNIYEICSEKNDDNFNLFKAVIDKWSLGRYSIENTYIDINNKDEILNEIITLADELKSSMSAEGLSILYSDLEEIFRIDGKTSELESKVLHLIKKSWKAKLLDLHNIISNIIQNDNSYNNSLFALGFLFYSAIKIDGNIDKLEIMQVRRNLEAWDNHAARLILESINFYELLLSNNNFLNMFPNYIDIADEDKRKIINCICYLKNNEVKEVRKIMYEQIMAIIKADSVIADEERWLSSEIRRIWDDL